MQVTVTNLDRYTNLEKIWKTKPAQVLCSINLTLHMLKMDLATEKKIGQKSKFKAPLNLTYINKSHKTRF